MLAGASRKLKLAEFMCAEIKSLILGHREYALGASLCFATLMSSIAKQNSEHKIDQNSLAPGSEREIAGHNWTVVTVKPAGSFAISGSRSGAGKGRGRAR